MVSSRFASFSQNAEDVVLWRALHHVERGRYLDVGANHPYIDSVSKAFYDRGWSGITVEPDPAFAQMQRDQRPRDLVVQAAITTKDGDLTTFHVVDGTGLSTLDADTAKDHVASGFDVHDVQVATRRLDCVLEEAGWEGLDIHFMLVDTEGSERDVLESLDLRVWRPWVLVVEATHPRTTVSTREVWEAIVIHAGYRFCLFDGLSCFYVAEEHARSLGQALSFPACVLDDYTRLDYREQEERARCVPELVAQVSRWRAQTVARWAATLAARAEVERLEARLEELENRHRAEAEDLRGFIDEMLQSTSWRVTTPLRVAGRLRRGRH